MRGLEWNRSLTVTEAVMLRTERKEDFLSLTLKLYLML
jgi:hypothetical protein